MHRVVVIGVLTFGAVLSGAGLVASLVMSARAQGEAGRAAQDEAEREAARRAYLQSIEIPAFRLIDQDGEAFTDADLSGDGYLVLDFMFSHCIFACPLMSGNMKHVYEQTAGLAVRFASISVDPVNDTPERLREYADVNLNVDTARWRFVTGDAKVVDGFARALGFELAPDPTREISLPDGGTMINIIHPTRFVLFGPDGRVLDSYKAMEQDEVDRLLGDLDALTRGDAADR